MRWCRARAAGSRAPSSGSGLGRDPHALALFSEKLPPGLYALGEVPDAFAGAHAAYAWAIGTYAFDRYRGAGKGRRKHPRLLLPPGVDGEAVSRLASKACSSRATSSTRPPTTWGRRNWKRRRAGLPNGSARRSPQSTGDALLAANYPMIHAVGRASTRAPRLIDFVWGAQSHPRLTLVGKGVCFDTGGLDLKNSSGMLTMKKDMGGAACMLGLAQMVMEARLPVRLRVLIPAVENSVSGAAFRPGDVLPSRKGLFVEIGNTDAEGRLVLADALTEADREKPALLLCLATLTGAARAATGMDLPPYFTDDEKLAADLMRHAGAEFDPLWRLPLWRPYESAVDSSIADVNNAPDYPLAGAITAALFLNRFITKTESWAHFDIPAWTDRPKPGRRKGAEANAIRALFALIAERYGKVS